MGQFISDIIQIRGVTTVGAAFAELTNPGAITFVRINADNSVSALSASDFRTAIGAGTGSGDALTSGTLAQFASTTSLQLKTLISDETGSGSLVFATSPTLVTPVLGAATATSINGLTLTSSTGTLTIANGKTLAASNTLTLTATDGSTLAIGGGGTLGTAAFTAATAYVATTGTQTIDGAKSFTTGITVIPTGTSAVAGVTFDCTNVTQNAGEKRIAFVGTNGCTGMNWTIGAQTMAFQSNGQFTAPNIATSGLCRLTDYAVQRATAQRYGMNQTFSGMFELDAVAGTNADTSWAVKTSTTNSVEALRLDIDWSIDTHATRKARAVWGIFDTANREAMRFDATGSAAKVGFLGAVGTQSVYVNGSFGATDIVHPTAAPASPTNGSIWVESGKLYYREGNVTYELTGV